MSLDGGGIRGLYGACILALIEKEITKGEPIANFFDMIAGTSTGGIMALGLGLTIPADKIERLYRVDGKQIFRQPWYWRIPKIKLVMHCFQKLYDCTVLEKLLYREFGNKTIGESSARLVIPAFMTPKTEIAVFKTDHHPDYKNDYKVKAWEVARATSAAPTYLSGHENDDVLFLDGGIWANNPVMIAVIDALSAYNISREQIQILSIGTGNFPFEITMRQAKKGLFRWKEVIKAAMFLTTDNAHAQAALLLGPQNIVRLEPLENACHIELDDWKEAVKLLPEMANTEFQNNRARIASFFEHAVHKRDKFYSS